MVALAACGSKKKKPTGESTSATPTGSAQTTAAGTAPAAASGDLVWNEVPPIIKKGGPRVSHHISVPPPPPIADPDAVIARYKAECPKGPTSAPCTDLKHQVERILLDTIKVLRTASVPIDRKWWHVGARADLAQLACMSAFALSREKERTPDDDAAILAAFEHPAPSVWSAAAASKLPALEPLFTRVESGRWAYATCFDGRIDRSYDRTWAGGYPTATFRFFASSAKRRWFTTSDSIEKVAEFFTKGGRTPQTEAELGAQMAQKMSAEIMRITEKYKEDEVEKMNAEVQGLAAKFVPPKFTVDGAGEVRYVNLSSNLWLAIFKDDILKATSIVAIAPPPAFDASPEGLQRLTEARRVYGF